jgi:hypothetical protein
MTAARRCSFTSVLGGRRHALGVLRIRGLALVSDTLHHRAEPVPPLAWRPIGSVTVQRRELTIRAVVDGNAMLAPGSERLLAA